MVNIWPNGHITSAELVVVSFVMVPKPMLFIARFVVAQTQILSLSNIVMLPNSETSLSIIVTTSFRRVPIIQLTWKM
jgi:hypothetical protein